MALAPPGPGGARWVSQDTHHAPVVQPFFVAPLPRPGDCFLRAEALALSKDQFEQRLDGWPAIGKLCEKPLDLCGNRLKGGVHSGITAAFARRGRASSAVRTAISAVASRCWLSTASTSVAWAAGRCGSSAIARRASVSASAGSSASTASDCEPLVELRVLERLRKLRRHGVELSRERGGARRAPPRPGRVPGQSNACRSPMASRTYASRS
ncbi:MAG: hypothetical protein KatS3mg059_0684 [Thermomicrobiales bacterium]|nr:MAG: hypothetical protein KatS3mg059_0684 [Thermomicrobiales bacterium]